MRVLALLGFLTFAVARHAQAQTPEPEEPLIELGPPPPPPPGASELEPDAPTHPAPAPIAPAPAPISRPSEPKTAPPVPAPSDRPRSASKPRDGAGWYGWKILIADGGALVLALNSEPLGTILGGGAYVLTAPSIHLGHKRGFAALGSLTLRIAAPLALNALIPKEPCNSGSCIQPGVLAGALLASVVDVALLAHDSPKPEKKATRLTPAIASAGRKSTTLVLTGSF